MSVKKYEKIIIVIKFSVVYGLFCVNNVGSTIHSKKDENLLLKPMELVNFVREEQRSPENTVIRKRHETATEVDSKIREEVTEKMEPNSEVDTGAVGRKVWSRWSKWGQCSATCGRGTKTRRRLCFGGRCAPGEREEQRLPCCYQPCELNSSDLSQWFFTSCT